MKILVINSGSSSLKFKLFLAASLEPKAKGLIENIGANGGSKAQLALLKGKKIVKEICKEDLEIKNHKEAITLMNELFAEVGSDLKDLLAIGHRVVHGGEEFKGPVVIDEDVIKKLEKLSFLAPLHNPSNIEGIKMALEHHPDIPQVAVFDTAFHQDMAEYAYLYPLPFYFYKDKKIRRYGFHGTSHSYVSRAARDFLSLPPDKYKMITLHLGNGASAAAIKNGKCIDTSMGLTPLEGLMMGTRCGDIDPSIAFFMMRHDGITPKQLEDVFNRKSGLKGICGEYDMRKITDRVRSGDRLAELALEMFCYRIKKYIGAYWAALGGVDCLVFTGGIGENSSLVREKSLEGLESLGILLDLGKNHSNLEEITDISAKKSNVKILVIKTNEELEIARQTMKTI